MNDLISREEAFEAAYQGLRRPSNDPAWIRICNELKNVPSAQQWISVSERLPEVRRSVILSTKNWTGEGCYWETTKHHVIWKGYRWNATYWDDEVVAWRPLPEPFKEGGE